MSAHRLGEAFRHGTGHGVGLAAINHDAEPRLAPGSGDVLEAGMVCNVEPAAYVDGVGGVRHCDMVLVTATGHELLTPFHASLESLVLESAARGAEVRG
jgi:Xaa-Pro aminopeptidase